MTEIRVDVDLAHPRERVWHALTEASVLASWFPTSAFLLTEDRRHFTIRPIGIAGLEDTIEGELVSTEAPTRMVMRWRAPQLQTLVSISLEETESGCRLSVAQRGFLGPRGTMRRRVLQRAYADLITERLIPTLARLAAAERAAELAAESRPPEPPAPRAPRDPRRNHSGPFLRVPRQQPGGGRVPPRSSSAPGLSSHVRGPAGPTGVPLPGFGAPFLARDGRPMGVVPAEEVARIAEAAAAEEPISQDPTGGGTTDGETAGGETTGCETTGCETASGGTASGGTASGGTTGGETTGGETTSGGTTSGETASGEMASRETAEGKAAGEDALEDDFPDGTPTAPPLPPITGMTLFGPRRAPVDDGSGGPSVTDRESRRATDGEEADATPGLNREPTPPTEAGRTERHVDALTAERPRVVVAEPVAGSGAGYLTRGFVVGQRRSPETSAAAAAHVPDENVDDDGQAVASRVRAGFAEIVSAVHDRFSDVPRWSPERRGQAVAGAAALLLLLALVSLLVAKATAPQQPRAPQVGGGPREPGEVGLPGQERAKDSSRPGAPAGSPVVPSVVPSGTAQSAGPMAPGASSAPPATISRAAVTPTLTAVYRVEKDAVTGYDASIVINNLSSEPADGWTVVLRVPALNLLVHDVTGANGQQEPGVVTFLPVEATRVVPPGMSVKIGFQVDGVGRPTACTINKEPCTGIPE